MAAPEDELDTFLTEVHHALAAAGPLSEKARTGCSHRQSRWFHWLCGE